MPEKRAVWLECDSLLAVVLGLSHMREMPLGKLHARCQGCYFSELEFRSLAIIYLKVIL